MKNSENLRKLLQAMEAFATAHSALIVEISDFERNTGNSVNDVPGFDGYYPFDTSLDELPINRWVKNVTEFVRASAFKVLNYEYLNTGGNCMVGIFTVWIPALKQTVYALTNEVGCSIVTADYISNELDIEDYDEVTIDRCDFDELQPSSTYYELYRHCLNEYTKSDCRYFGNTIAIPYHLLSDELQSEVHADYRQWCEENNNCCIPTDGKKIIIHPDYDDSTKDVQLSLFKAFKKFHDTTAANENFYTEEYVLSFAGQTIRLPFMADTWDAIDQLLSTSIENW